MNERRAKTRELKTRNETTANKGQREAATKNAAGQVMQERNARAN